MLSKKNRIGQKKAIEDLFKTGATYKNSFFIFKYKKIDLPHSSFAVSVSKKIFKSAVKRNRLRRQIYDAIRLHLPELNQPVMAFVIVRPSINQKAIHFQEISRAIHHFFNSIHSHAK